MRPALALLTALALMIGVANAADTERPPERPDPAETAPTAAPEARPGTPPNADADAGSGGAAQIPAQTAALPARESDQDYAACLLALSMLGTDFQERPAITDPDDPACGIARPVHIRQVIAGVTLEGGADMRCDTARALALWTSQFLRPAAAALPGAPRLTGMQTGTTYDCRTRIGTGDATPDLSEHAQGAAIDIAAFLLDGTEPLPVSPRTGTGDLPEAFQRAARGSACLFFTTVLGPGSNAAHDDHLHLDVIARNGGWRLCE